MVFNVNELMKAVERLRKTIFLEEMYFFVEIGTWVKEMVNKKKIHLNLQTGV